MIRSMTGFGRSHQIINGREILVEIKSVNHRYYEFSARLPRSFMYLEEKLKTLLQGKITRGKVEISVSIYNVGGKEGEVILNEGIVSSFVNAIRSAEKTHSLKDDLSLSHIFSIPDAFTVLRADVDEEEIWQDVSTVASEGLEKFVLMREEEGKRLKADILNHLEIIESLVKQVEVRSPKNMEEYRNKLYQRMKEILESRTVDEQRILLEAAIFSEKTSVDEETVRLKSHISQFREMVTSQESIGRKLDFLVQEFNREANTIGSKAQDIEITKAVVEMKSEIEKIREQIQNIE